jgi:septal ring factor EnvC (AmiA/AmiB activator)
MKRTILLKLVIIPLIFMATPVHADKALERAQFMLRQLNAQKVQLEQQNSQLKKELDAIKKDAAKQEKKAKAGSKKLSQSNKKKDAYIAKLKEKLKQTMIALRKSESERLQANKMGMSVDTKFKQCVTNNHHLVKMNDKLIDNYNNKGCWDTITHNEPFTGLKQVEIENILQEYRFANEDYMILDESGYEQAGDESANVLVDDDSQS